MQSSKQWLGAGLLALAGAAHAAQPSNEELQQQIQALQKAVDALKQQLQERSPTLSSASTETIAIPPAEIATKSDVEGLRTDLENYKYDQQRNRETKTALATRGTTIGGTIQTRATAQSPSVTTGSSTPANGRSSSFDIPLASIFFSGSLYRDYAEGRNLDYRIQLGYAPQSPAANNSNFNLQDAYLRYSPLPTKTGLEDPKLTITFGQQLLPFGLEVQTGEDLRPTIKSAQFLTTTGLVNRQIGAIVQGDLEPYVDYGFNYRAPLFQYAFGVVNGSGPNKSDDNNAKDWIARVAFTLPVDYYSLFRELKIGGTYYKGAKNVLNGTTIVDSGGKGDRYGIDLYYNHSPFGATYEYVQGRDDTYNAVTKKIDTITSRSHTATLFYTWGEQWLASSKSQAKFDDWWPKSYQLFTRWDQWDPNKDAANDKITISTLGFNVFFAETTKFQLNLNHYAYENPTIKSANELLAQFQFGF
ncbi:hypothetical protein [Andreprevotia chitinilytica]|uniref:hypothetical protein n=1 Tax=Andreprevotia chitinilytica TaxID=396808 RepID=UPI0005531182|nr:hypothetical protein [Andreprevotia chitinilytica]